MHLAVILLKQ